MFAMMKPFQAPPPEGAGVPFQWGSEGHVEELLGGAFELDLQRHVSHLRVPTGEDYWRLFAMSYGPTKTLAESLDDDRRDEFHQTWVDFFESNYRSDGEIDHDREWLFVHGIRR
jgi:hypothetical protein